jgi:hypothetical protein
LTHESIPPQLLAFYRLNRLFKYIRVFRHFTVYEHELTWGTHVVRLIKFSILITSVLHWSGASRLLLDTGKNARFFSHVKFVPLNAGPLFIHSQPVDGILWHAIPTACANSHRGFSWEVMVRGPQTEHC